MSSKTTASGRVGNFAWNIGENESNGKVWLQFTRFIPKGKSGFDTIDLPIMKYDNIEGIRLEINKALDLYKQKLANPTEQN